MFICQENNLNCTLIWTLLGVESVEFHPLWALGASRLSLRFTLEHVYSFPTNTVTKFHKLMASNNTSWFSESSGGQKSKARASVGLCFFWKLQKRIRFIILFGFWRHRHSLAQGPFFLLLHTPCFCQQISYDSLWFSACHTGVCLHSEL